MSRSLPTDLEPSHDFDTFVRWIFDRPYTGRDWYWDHGFWEAGEDPALASDSLRCLFTNCDTLLDPYPDGQIAIGFWFLISVFRAIAGLDHPSLDLDRRRRGLDSVNALYEKLFSKRCTAQRETIDEDSTPIDGICYMLWDACDHPPYQVCDPEDHWRAVQAALHGEPMPDVEWEPRPTIDCYYDIAAKTLRLPNETCLISALHGLGHWHLFDRRRTEVVIDQWLKELSGLISPTLLNYARAARVGHVQ